MKPYLIVDGKNYDIESIDFIDGVPTMAAIKIDGKRVCFYGWSLIEDRNSIDLENAIHWEGRYKPIELALEKAKSVHDGELERLAKEFIETFSTDGIADGGIISKYNRLNSIVSEISEIQTILHSIEE